MTDIHIIEGLFGNAKPPCILGHEIAAEVAEIFDSDSKWKIGHHVCVETVVSCNSCEYCLTGYKNLCYYGSDIGFPPYQCGYAEFVAVPANCLHLLPDNLSFEEAAILESFICPVGSFMRMPVKFGDSVLIQGLGPADLACIQGAMAMGATKIIVSDSNDNKLKLAKHYGATIIANRKNENLEEIIMGNTNNHDVDISIEVSGNPTVIEQAVALAKRNVLYGNPEDETRIQFPVKDIILKQLNIYGISGAPWAWERILSLFADGVSDVKKWLAL